MSKLKVWIDQDLCTGEGLCVEICPKHFAMHDDGLAYVKEASWADLQVGPDGPALQMGHGMAEVAEGDLADVIEAAEECPGECIFITETDD